MARVRRVRCQECNELVQREDLSEVNGNLICPECLSQYTECTDCGCLTKDVTATDEGTYVCEECCDNYGYCTNCNGVYNLDNMTLFNDEMWCENCHKSHIVTCEDCGREVLREDAYDVGDIYYWVCDDCVSSHVCERCENTFATLYDGLCEDCYNECGESDEIDDIIESYSYKPYPKFFGEGNRFFGVELETEPFNDGDGDADMVREVQSLVYEWGYLKHDGSLNAGGFELVTHPMTLEHHIEKFTPELFSTISNANYVSHTNGNCGLHIHISRKAFNSELAIVKLLEFVYGNYEEVVKKLGRRKDTTSYCRNNEISLTPKSIDRILQNNRGDRYHAINTQNTDTIELRFFRGTLVRDIFIGALQFADVITNLANNILDISQKIEWSDVYAEVDKLGYEELGKEMDKRLNKEELLGREYEGYDLSEEEEEETTSKIVETISSSSSSECGIIWSNNDVEQYNLEVLNEFNGNYINRARLDNGSSPRVPIGAFVQVMPLTMMREMRYYGRTYTESMRDYAGTICVVSGITESGFYHLSTMEYEIGYIWDRSSFRVLSEQEQEVIERYRTI